MHLSVAASKINKWAVRQSGDTLEMIERPHGGLSFVLADGQSSGEAAKAISIRVVRKVISELAEGVRDGAAARAANDMLYAQRRGKVSATLVILSVDLDSGSLVITQCGNSGIFVRPPGGDLLLMESEVAAAGLLPAHAALPSIRSIWNRAWSRVRLRMACCTPVAGRMARSISPRKSNASGRWNSSAQALADGLLETCNCGG